MPSLPVQAQLANGKACAAWRRTGLGACELTSLRHWSPAKATPSPPLQCSRSHKGRRAVYAQASLDVPEWDVVALGQSMVDISAYVDDAFISRMGVAKGGRRCQLLLGLQKVSIYSYSMPHFCVGMH